MAGYIESVVKSIFLPEECYNQLCLSNFSWPCFAAMASRVLGMAIIFGSVFVKVPQIMKIIKSGSSKGINIFGVLLELFAVTATVAYSIVKGFPFSSWGEGTFLGLQTATIAALVLHYAGARKTAATFVLAYAVAVAVLLGYTPANVLWTLQASNVPIVLSGKLIQAYTNYKSGSTGQLSEITCLLLFFGSIIRVFTSMQETGDFIIILTYVVATFANGVLVAQLFWYRKAGVTSMKKKVQ